jgi:signal transduction histidine kinase
MSIPTDETIQQEKLFRDVFEALPVAIILIDRQGFIKSANSAFLRMTALTHTEVTGKRFNSLFHAHLNFPEHDIDQTRHEPAPTSQLLLKLPGYNSPFNVQVAKVSDFFCFTFNSTEEKKSADHTSADLQTFPLALQNETLIEKLKTIGQHNRDLERSNQDLSQYAYVASHDLQEPLRKIRIFSDILVGSGQLSGKEKFIANKIMMASERMSFMVRDLLNYAKLLKADAVFEEVDLNEIVKAVLIDFEIKIQEKNAIVNFPDLPMIQGVKLQLNQLFYNLLGNALKFTIPGRPPEVLISVQEMDSRQARQFVSKPLKETSYLHIRFVDNGIGFEQEDSEQIFEVFRRLYPREVYEGSGIGLALCRRIVQNHGGCLFATSAPGKGSAFNIIIPTRHADSDAKKKGQNEDSAPL